MEIMILGENPAVTSALAAMLARDGFKNITIHDTSQRIAPASASPVPSETARRPVAGINRPARSEGLPNKP